MLVNKPGGGEIGGALVQEECQHQDDEADGHGRQQVQQGPLPKPSPKVPWIRLDKITLH